MARPFNLPKPLPSADELRGMFEYDRDTGVLTWAVRPDGSHRAKWWNSVFAGEPAGSTHPGSRYLRVMIKGNHHFVHRVAWKIETGEEAAIIDHVNGDGSDNRFENLRDASQDLNMKNKAIYQNNSSGVAGVLFHKRDKVWTARIGLAGEQLRLGSFQTRNEAIAAVLAARLVLEYHPNHGRKVGTKET